MATLITNIAQLINVRTESKVLRGKELAELPMIQNAFLIVDKGIIIEYGKMDDLTAAHKSIENTIDAAGATILPCWADSHTHIVFAASREEEFVYRIKGMTYEQIAEKGGGILNSAKKLNAASEEELLASAMQRVHNLIKLGTGAIEIKSGYGLSVEGELKMLRVIKKLKEQSPIPIKATFLAAHAYPMEYRQNHQAYIDLIINEMLPVIAKEDLADYIDVFCEKGFFSVEEAELICNAGKQYGLQATIHAHQLNNTGAVQLGVKLEAVSVCHLEYMDEAAINNLANSNTIGTILPSAAFFLNMDYPPARAMIDANCAVALATDYNPGSSPGGSMQFVVALASVKMGMLPEEAINAATLNAAAAMGLSNELGSITIGKKANLIFTKPIPSIAFIPYSFSHNLIDKVMIGGEFYE